MSQQKGGSFVRDKLARDVLVLPHSRYRYVRGRELLHSFRTDFPYFARETFLYLVYPKHLELYTCTSNLSLSRVSTFRTRKRERKRSRKEEEQEYCIARRKFVQGIDSMFPKRSELGLRDRTAEERGGKRGSCTFFASF